MCARMPRVMPYWQRRMWSPARPLSQHCRKRSASCWRSPAATCTTISSHPVSGWTTCRIGNTACWQPRSGPRTARGAQSLAVPVKEDVDLTLAEPALTFNQKLDFAGFESEYRDTLRFLEAHRARLAVTGQNTAQFYARADNLSHWLGMIEKRLGSLSQRLSASVGQRLNTDLAAIRPPHNPPTRPRKCWCAHRGAKSTIFFMRVRRRLGTNAVSRPPRSTSLTCWPRRMPPSACDKSSES